MKPRRYIYYPLAAGAFTPLVIMMKASRTSVADIFSHMSLMGLLVFMLLPLFPFVVLIGAVFSTGLKGARLACVFWFGFIALWGFTVYGHWTMWTSKSSTAGIGVLFIPVYALGPLAIGLSIGWVVSLLPTFQEERTSHRREKRGKMRSSLFKG